MAIDLGGKYSTQGGRLFATLPLRLSVLERTERVATETVNALAEYRPLPHCKSDSKLRHSPRCAPHLCFGGEHGQYTPPFVRSTDKDSHHERIQLYDAGRHVAGKGRQRDNEGELPMGQRIQVEKMKDEVERLKKNYLYSR